MSEDKNKNAKKIVDKLTYSEKYNNTSNRIKINLDSILMTMLISDYFERKGIDKVQFFNTIKEKLRKKYKKEVDNQIEAINSDETLSVYWGMVDMDLTVQLEEQIFEEALNEIISLYKNL